MRRHCVSIDDNGSPWGQSKVYFAVIPKPNNIHICLFPVNYM